MADLPASRSDIRQSANHIYRWWTQQLWECIPAAVRGRMVQSRRPAMWSAAADRFWPAGGALDQGKPFSHSSMAQSGGTVALVVGESNGFRREIELPLAVESRISEVLSYELDRLTPLRASELHYDYVLKRRNAAESTCTVELIAVPRRRLAPVMEGAAKKNLKVTRVLLSPQDVDTSVDLLRHAPDREQRVAGGPKWINVALVGICVSLALALVAIPLWQKRQYVIELQPVEVAAKADAEVASALQQQLDKQLADYNLPLARKHGSPLAVQVLDDLSKRLPEDTWAQVIEIRTVPNQKAKEVVVQGETGSGAKLLQYFQESPLLKEAAFKTAMTRVAPTAERFHVTAELVTGGMPKQLLLAEADTAVTLPLQVAPSAPAGAPSASSKAGSAVAASAPSSVTTVAAPTLSTPGPVAVPAPTSANPALPPPIPSGPLRRAGAATQSASEPSPAPPVASDKKP